MCSNAHAKFRFLLQWNSFICTASRYDEVGFTTLKLDAVHHLYVGSLPLELVPDADEFDRLWDEHPDDYHQIHIHGRDIATPRWQQAYGHDYHYTGRSNIALPMLPALEPLVKWCQHSIDERLNGVLLNWYDAAHGHYIGKHRDSTKNVVVGSPIVTISLGSARTFRMRPWKGTGYRDLAATNGNVIVIPYETNQAYTHEVLRLAKDEGRRISMTLRCFV